MTTATPPARYSALEGARAMIALAPIGGFSDASDAFADPGVAGVVSSSDIVEDAAPGCDLTSAGVAVA